MSFASQLRRPGSAIRVLTLALALLCPVAAVRSQGRANSPVTCGADVFVHDYGGLPRTSRLGIIANHTSVLASGTHLVDSIINAGRYTITAIFTPEHGFRGDHAAGEAVTGSRYRNIPVYSLYGASRTPTPAMLAGIDVLVYDIQDVGVRFYTYISTLAICMEAAARSNIRFIVLDRPNPINGITIEGPVRDDAHKSFLGWLPIPVRYGLTAGELAKMARGEAWIRGAATLRLQVVPMRGWKRRMRYEETGCRWIPPSPNIPSPETARMYAGTCLLEGTNISEGRGTPAPFLQFGAPFLSPTALLRALTPYALNGVKFTPIRVRVQPSKTPNGNKFENEEIAGLAVRVQDRDAPSFRTGMAVLFALREVLGEQLRTTRHLSLLLGKAVPGALAGGTAGFRRWIARCDREARSFGRARRKYLLYD